MSAAVTRLETSLSGVTTSTASNRLMLNADKTEPLWSGPRFSAEDRLGSEGPSVQIGSETVFLSQAAGGPCSRSDNCV